MYELPAESEDPGSSTATSMGVASETLVQITHRLCGTFPGKMFLVTIDAYSKWLDVQVVNAATSRVTIERLRTLFATHGIPEIVVSDNGTAFTSAEFSQFMTKNGIRHAKIAPHHPSSNGLAERAVKTFKEGMKKCISSSSESIECCLSRVLFQYRITPHSTTGVSPSELLYGRRIRSHLDLIQPDLARHVEAKQMAQKKNHDRHSRDRVFQIGDLVFIKNFGNGLPWLPGEIKEIQGPVSYSVLLNDGRSFKRHVDQIRVRTVPDSSVNTPDSILDDCLPPPTAADNVLPNADPPPLRRSSRIRHPPDRYTPDNVH